LIKGGPPCGTASGGSPCLQLRIYPGGIQTKRPLLMQWGEDVDNHTGLRTLLGRRLNLVKYTDPNRLEYKQPWAMFNTSGARLESTYDLIAAGEVFIIEGGQFIWPGVRVGFLQKAAGKYLRTLSLQPLVFSVKHFLEWPQLKHITSLTRNESAMSISPLSRRDLDKLGTRNVQEYRTSTQRRLARNSDEQLSIISDQIMRLTKIPAEHQEDFQLLWYKQGGFYKLHHDFSTHEWHHNRLATALSYLSPVTSGGHTIFPMARGLPFPETHELEQCDGDLGLKVQPEINSLILFYNLHPSGQVDTRSLHGACPVTKGDKLAVNFWVWNKPYSEIGEEEANMRTEELRKTLETDVPILKSELSKAEL